MPDSARRWQCKTMLIVKVTISKSPPMCNISEKPSTQCLGEKRSFWRFFFLKKAISAITFSLKRCLYSCNESLRQMQKTGKRLRFSIRCALYALSRTACIYSGGPNVSPPPRGCIHHCAVLENCMNSVLLPFARNVTNLCMQDRGRGIVYIVLHRMPHVYCIRRKLGRYQQLA